MDELEKIRAFINANDMFCQTNHMTVTELTEGAATARLTSGLDMLNAHGVIQGGAIFTLADMAFAAAANSYPGERCTSMTSTISFLRPGTGAGLTARAKVVNRGRRSCLVEITVTDDAEKMVAKVATTGFFLTATEKGDALKC